MRRPGKSERGVALLMVVVSIAILAAVAAEFAFNSRVDLELAVHQRDALRAEYLAKSSLGMARLLLMFQKQLDKNPLNIPGLNIPGLSGATGTSGAAGITGAAAAASSAFNVQLWRLARVDCHMLEALLPQERDLSAKLRGSAPREMDAEGRMKYGGFAGCFDARIQDEQEKLNVNAMAGLQTGTAQGAVQRLYKLITDKRFEFVFDREDANRVRVMPPDVVLGLKDWVDDDETQSSLNVNSLGVVTLQNGFSDEAGLYSRYTPRYRPKNASFDSLGELFLVNGVGDRFMAAFGDRLTVYPDPNAPLNVNSDDPLILALAIQSIADPNKPDPRLLDPVFLDGIIQKIRAARALTPLGMTVQDFVTIVQQAGVGVNSLVLQRQQGAGTANTFLGDKSDTFRVVATGQAGNVEHRVTAVIRLKDPQQDGLGRVLYWRDN
jgi:general secretion pathway protein K